MFAIKTSNTRDIDLHNKILEKRDIDGKSLILTNVPTPPESVQVVSVVTKLTDIVSKNQQEKLGNKRIFKQKNILNIPMFIIEIKNSYLILTAKQTGGQVIGPKGKWAKKLFSIFGIDTIHVLNAKTYNKVNVEMLKEQEGSDLLVLDNNGKDLVLDITGYL